MWARQARPVKAKEAVNSDTANPRRNDLAFFDEEYLAVLSVGRPSGRETQP
jgi:hypothetical protein